MMIWQDRNMSECFKVFYVKLYVHSLVDKLKWINFILKFDLNILNKLQA